jgi:NAD-dependent aldehyde dehydrogenases
LNIEKRTLYERTEILLNTARLLEEHKETMAEIISYEAKKPIKFALQEVDRSIQTLKLSGIEASKLEGEYINLDVAANGGGRNAFTKYESLGVVYAMTPFNFPLNLVIHKVGPALAVGNSVIVKPSEKTPFSTYF